MTVAEAPLRGGDAPYVAVAGAETLIAVLKADDPLPTVVFRQEVEWAPVAAGQRVGELEFTLEGQTVRVPAVAVSSVRESFLRSLLIWPSSGLLAACLAAALCVFLVVRKAGAPENDV